MLKIVSQDLMIKNKLLRAEAHERATGVPPWAYGRGTAVGSLANPGIPSILASMVPGSASAD